MTREEATRIACSLTALAYRSVGDYHRSSDGFCSSCPASRDSWSYQNDGFTFRFMRDAILAHLKVQRYDVDQTCLDELNSLLEGEAK